MCLWMPSRYVVTMNLIPAAASLRTSMYPDVLTSVSTGITYSSSSQYSQHCSLGAGGDAASSVASSVDRRLCVSHMPVCLSVCLLLANSVFLQQCCITEENLSILSVRKKDNNYKLLVHGSMRPFVICRNVIPRFHDCQLKRCILDGVWYGAWYYQ